jgi:hypothetical protein
VTFVELIGSILLIGGLLSRLAAFPLTINLVAILLVKVNVGLLSSLGGNLPSAELDLALIAGFFGDPPCRSGEALAGPRARPRKGRGREDIGPRVGIGHVSSPRGQRPRVYVRVPKELCAVRPMRRILARGMIVLEK